MLDPQIIALIASLFTALLAFAKWAVGQWSTVRREDFAQSERMIAALVAQAASNEALRAEIAALRYQLDAGFESISKVNAVPKEIRKEVRDTYPPPPRVPRERVATSPTGHQIREPRRGSHHDAED